jgi:hypothetical protein
MPEDWYVVASRLFNEGASSFINQDQIQRVFTKQAWALRSIRDAQYPNESYTAMTADPGVLSAHNKITGAPPWAVTYAEQILTDHPDKQPYPFTEPQGTILHWMSPQNWPARHENGQIVTFSSPQMCPDPNSPCQLPDIRLVQWAADLSADYEARFVDITMNEYNTQQCYWIGVYFVKEENWNAVLQAPQMPVFNCQEPHSCPVNTN